MGGHWHDWGACDRCGGLRKRYRHIQQMASSSGEQCKTDDLEQVESCSRRCDGDFFCVWGPWLAWSDCSSTCGTGRQSRRRELIKSQHQASTPLVDVDYLSQKFEALQLDMDTRQHAH